MNTSTTAYIDGLQVDLTNCDQEPIQVPGCVQPHGMLFVLQEPDLVIRQLSNNTLSFLGLEPDTLLNQSIDCVLSIVEMDQLRLALVTKNLEANPHFLTSHETSQGHSLNLIVHRYQGALILEMEPAATENPTTPPSFYHFVKESLYSLKATRSLEEFYQAVSREIKKTNGFDRVMVYQFDENGNGSVVAEEKEAHLEPYLGLHYPATDIPRQARELYLRNLLRFISDVDYTAAQLVPLANPQTGQPLDMSYAVLRSVSPIHIEYLQNMGVKATMTISLILNNQLWGLIACHHYSPRYVPYEVRTACELMGHFISLELAARQSNAEAAYQLELQTMQTEFVEYMSREENLADGLIKFQPNLSNYIRAEGAAISLNGQYQFVGVTPDEKEVKRLIGWLRKNMTGDMFSTSCLSERYPNGESIKETASGLLAVSISSQPGNYALWFRPEILQTIDWAGDPSKPVQAVDTMHLSPRRSFELWKQEVKLSSEPWTEYEKQAALEVRHAIMRVILRKSEEIAKKNEDLERRVIERTTQLLATNKELEAFSYSVSHDLRAPLRSVDGYSQALLEESGDKLNEQEKTYLHYIREGSQRMGSLIEDLINLSRITRNEMLIMDVDLGAMAHELFQERKLGMPERQITLKAPGHLIVKGDSALLRIMLENLISNAWKFTQYKESAEVQFGLMKQGGKSVYFVKDNGAGFKNKYAHKIFGAFQRLHREEEFPGTGIGLATVQRVIHRHGGQIWAEGEVGQGATFYFTLHPDTIEH